MARMIPDPIRPETKSEAERFLYREFKTQLPDDYTVFHNVAWQLPDQRGTERDGETDFIIVHPDDGILLVEVKGGIVRREGATGAWFSGQYAIHDPFQQVMSNKHSLLRLLHTQPFWRNRWITLGHAVALPDSFVAQPMIGPEAPRTIVLDRTQTAGLTAWVKGVMAHWAGQDSGRSGPGKAGVTAMVEMLSPTVTLRPLWAQDFEVEQHEMLTLTERQYAALDCLRRTRRAAISGCAGSGKTMLAVEKAKRLADQGFTVLLTCFNTDLAQYLGQCLKNRPTIHVESFHSLCMTLGRQAGLLPRTANNGSLRPQSFYDNELPDILMQAADVLAWHVNAVIVDEGQDLNENAWIALQCLLHDSHSGIIYVFYDDNQNLYQLDPSIPLEASPYILSENLRNTQNIHRLVQIFYRSDHGSTARGPEGRAVEIERYATAQEFRTLLRQKLHALIHIEKIDPADIVILTPRAFARSLVHPGERIGNYVLTDRPGDANDILLTSIYKFKGLEKPVVVLIEIEPETFADVQTLLYVGGSRANNHLILIAHRDCTIPI